MQKELASSLPSRCYSPVPSGLLRITLARNEVSSLVRTGLGKRRNEQCEAKEQLPRGTDLFLSFSLFSPILSTTTKNDRTTKDLHK